METVQDAVFLVDADALLELTRTPYELEDDFQAQLARYPELLGGGQYPGVDPRRWLLVDREVPICAQSAVGFSQRARASKLIILAVRGWRFLIPVRRHRNPSGSRIWHTIVGAWVFAVM